MTWIRLVQAAKFKEELVAAAVGLTLIKKNPLVRLTPFLDVHGIFRVSGRIKHVLLAYDEKHPIILPSKSLLTSLIIDSCHSRVLHGGVQQTLGLLRQRFWISGGRCQVQASSVRSMAGGYTAYHGSLSWSHVHTLLFV